MRMTNPNRTRTQQPRLRGRTALAFLVAGALLAAAAPATAETATVTADSGADVPARCEDMKSVRIANGDTALRFLVRMKAIKHRCTQLTFYWDMEGDPGWAYQVDLKWRGNHKVVRFREEQNVGQWEKKVCARLRARTLGGKQVAVRVPQSCMFGPRPFENFAILSTPKGGPRPIDSAHHAGALDAD